MLCLQQLLETYRPQSKNNYVLSNQTFPKTPDTVSIQLNESPEYGSTDEFWDEMCAISRKKLEEEYQQLPIDEQTAKGEDFLGLLFRNEIDTWNERTLHWYDSGESQHKNPIKYITKQDVVNFITNCSALITSQIATTE